ncbi:MAG: TolC family protein [Treponema sp.]|jgi:multidrug efflux system outer membrane protein|nr:TolC family protein [Treponema sp.]
MRFLAKLLCVLFVCGITVPLKAEDSPDSVLVLSLDEAINRALAYSINLQTSRIDLDDREYASTHLWSLVFPSINITGSVGYDYRNSLFTTAPATPAASQSGGFSYSTSVGLRLQFTAGIPSRMKLLTLAYERQLLTYENARRQLEIAVVKEFYNLIAERENLNQLAETLSLAERQVERHRIGRDNGLVSETALLQSQLAVETARYALSSAQATYSNSIGAFLISLGLPPETPVTLEGDIDVRQVDVDPEELIRDYLPKRPDIVQQSQEIERLELTRRQTLLDARSPSVSLSLGWAGGGNIPGAFSDSVTVSGSVALSIPINSWIPGTSDFQTLRTAESAIEKAKLDLKNTEALAQNQIRSFTATLRNSWESLEIARMREELAERSYELTERGFVSGVVESLTLETSRNNLAAARYQLLRSQLTYQNLVLDLAQAINADWRQFIIRSSP